MKMLAAISLPCGLLLGDTVVIRHPHLSNKLMLLVFVRCAVFWDEFFEHLKGPCEVDLTHFVKDSGVYKVYYARRIDRWKISICRPSTILG